jgi:hypothetical protein
MRRRTYTEDAQRCSIRRWDSVTRSISCCHVYLELIPLDRGMSQTTARPIVSPVSVPVRWLNVCQ